MREIKFRGKTKEGKWVYGYYIKLNLNSGCEYKIVSDTEKDFGIIYEVIPESVGEYIGKKDMNGNEIYECDIVKYLGTICVVNYKSSSYTCGFLLNGKFEEGYESNPYFSSTLEIIGNIHENKDILSKGK